MWRELQKFGKKLVTSGLTHSHFGNISLRVGDKILISRSGSMLDELDESMIVEVLLHKSTSFDIIASSETVVHREIYKNTQALAIIHAHPPYCVAVSLLENTDYIVPNDSESKYFLHKIPIITGGVGSTELAKNAASVLKSHKGAIIKGHGIITAAKFMEEAFVYAASLEHAAKVYYLTKYANKPHI